jgi:hypothetical protein
MGADSGYHGLAFPAPLQELQERVPVLLIFLRHFG